VKECHAIEKYAEIEVATLDSEFPTSNMEIPEEEKKKTTAST
jgi:hypothetical protein